MAVFTVFFCGTGSNSFDFRHKDDKHSGPDVKPEDRIHYHSGELVSTLARNAGGMEFVDWIIVDGPGSGNLQEDDKFVKPGNYSKGKGTRWGSGWEENVGHAMAMIRGDATWSRKELTELGRRIIQDSHELEGREPPEVPDERLVTQQSLQMQKIKIFRKDKPITQINAIGWSRGAVTTHMFAHALAEDPDLKHIPVNIVAVDPVTGPRNSQLNRTSIPSNVKHYVAFYAQDELSVFFEPVVPSLADGVQSAIYTLPGRHATLVGNAGNYIGTASDPESGTDTFFSPARVVRMLSEHYLTSWGTALKLGEPYSDTVMLECYDKMVEQEKGYVALRNTTYKTNLWRSERPVTVGQSWFNTNFSLVPQLKPDDWFINWHHRSLFEQHFPQLYAPLSRHEWPNSPEAHEAVRRVETVAPSTWKALTDLLDPEGIHAQKV
ncbi:hypothetical protein FAZ95_08110 [Trinickia violacea]|uniref:DUF2235 domain-containing protein n=1 Tax=Trinickia violacea TaxID=2571746 RepID=A0A4P8IQ14_9BURK|nr:hypothetical protein [Trinickia violacea]QCP49143.1 hypothetical protein FAZ95_08110 [Trinickia violacea]